MNLRSVLAVTIALSSAFVLPAHAGKPVGLDGVRRTHVTYEGRLDDAAISAESAALMEADRADCTATSCDMTAVRITPPKGSEGGTFKAIVTTTPTLTVAIALYDARGNRIAYTDVPSGGWVCCMELPYMQVTFTVSRLYGGNYTLVVFDRGGQGDFKTDLDYKANPPARQRGKN